MTESAKTSDDLFTVTREDATVVIGSVRGEIDLHTSSELRGGVLKAIARNKPKKLILNLAGVPYMDSSAIAVLVESLKELRKLGGKVVLTDLQPRVKGLLEIARLDSIFGIAKDETEALAK